MWKILENTCPGSFFYLTKICQNQVKISDFNAQPSKLNYLLPSKVRNAFEISPCVFMYRVSKVKYLTDANK